MKKKKETWQAIRKIRQNEEEFELYPEFITKAQDIYIKAHNTMAKCVTISFIHYIYMKILFLCFHLFSKDKNKLLEYVTEKAYVVSKT